MSGWQVGGGSMYWIYIGETIEPYNVMYPLALRLLSTFIIGAVFPLMVQGLTIWGAFLVFLGCTIVSLLYLAFEMKESLKCTREQIYYRFLRNSNRAKFREEHENFEE